MRRISSSHALMSFCSLLTVNAFAAASFVKPPASSFGFSHLIHSSLTPLRSAHSATTGSTSVSGLGVRLTMVLSRNLVRKGKLRGLGCEPLYTA